MKILIISQHIFPMQTPRAHRTTELVKEFLLGFVRTANITLHLRQLAGENSHHILEGVFKALGRTLKKACTEDPNLNGAVFSTKGVL
ncbi:MAG: hypothetical protein EOM05_10180 [Clostridia bacterium]|nr:hypothetical protein [Clostridia bacterium]